MSRVPVASVPRFRSVSQFYGDALMSRKFAKLHSGPSRVLIGVLNLQSAANGPLSLEGSTTRFFVVDPEQEGGAHAIEVPVPIISQSRVVYAGSMKGLLLLVLKNEKLLKAICSQVPLGRLAEPEEVAFLCMPAASYITGQTVCID